MEETHSAGLAIQPILDPTGESSCGLVVAAHGFRQPIDVNA